MNDMKLKLRRALFKKDKTAPIEVMEKHVEYIRKPTEFEHIECNSGNSHRS